MRRIDKLEDRIAIREYDVFHTDNGGAILTLDKAVDAVWPAIAEYRQNVPRDIEAEARVSVRAILKRERKMRGNQLVKQFDWVYDALLRPGEGAIGVEAMLNRAYPLGTAKGEDRLLGHWTPQDISSVVVTRYREAAQSTNAAAELDKSAAKVLIIMSETGSLNIAEAIARRGGAEAAS